MKVTARKSSDNAYLFGDSVVPIVDSVYDIGTSTSRWRNAHVDNLVMDERSNVVQLNDTPLLLATLFEANIPFDFTEYPLYNAFGAVNPTKSYFKVPTKGLYMLQFELNILLAFEVVPDKQSDISFVLKDAANNIIYEEETQEFGEVIWLEILSIPVPILSIGPSPNVHTMFFVVNDLSARFELYYYLNPIDTLAAGDISFKKNRLVRIYSYD